MCRTRAGIACVVVALRAGPWSGVAGGQIIQATYGLQQPIPGTFVWSTSLLLATGAEVRNGDYHVFYDFPGFLSGPSVPSGWTGTVANVTPPPPGVTLPRPDDPNLPNIIVTRTGGTFINPSSTNAWSLGNVSAASSVGTISAFDMATAHQSHANLGAPPARPNTGQGRASAMLSQPTISGTGPYTWTYRLAIGSYSQVQPGDSVTLYDFGDFLPGSLSLSSGWSATTALLTAPPPGVTPQRPDDPNVLNLTLTRTGPAIGNPPSSSTGDTDAVIGTISVQVLTPNFQERTMAYQMHNFFAIQADPLGTGQSSVMTPLPIPEPSSILLLAGAALAGTVRRCRRVARGRER